MRKIHIAISTNNIEESIKDYSARLGVAPCSFVANEYALWRTATVNFSIRKDSNRAPGALRHLGWEDESSSSFSEEKDVNGLTWERFSAKQQAAEINTLWPAAAYDPK